MCGWDPSRQDETGESARTAGADPDPSMRTRKDMRGRYVILRVNRFTDTETWSRKHKNLSGVSGSRDGSLSGYSWHVLQC